MSDVYYERFRSHMEYDSNTLIWAPRRSGKSFAITRRFVETRNSILFVTHHRMKNIIHEYLIEFGYQDRRSDVHSMTGEFNVNMSRRLDFIFIDEIDYYQGDLNDFLRGMVPRLTDPNYYGRIISVSSPSRFRPTGYYNTWFPNQLHIDDGVINDSQHHFNEELFII